MGAMNAVPGGSGNSAAPALSADRLSKRFGSRVAFDDVTFEIGHGEVQQLATLASLPSVALTTLIALNAIDASLTTAVVAAAALLLLNRIGWRVASAVFDRERLITGTK